MIAPVYPEALRSRHIEGDVCVQVLIDTVGRATITKILRESPYPELTDSVRAAVADEEYTPAITEDGIPHPARIAYCYRFRWDCKP
jgi:TonB family protein